MVETDRHEWPESLYKNVRGAPYMSKESDSKSKPAISTDSYLKSIKKRLCPQIPAYKPFFFSLGTMLPQGKE